MSGTKDGTKKEVAEEGEGQWRRSQHGWAEIGEKVAKEDQADAITF